MEKNFVFRTYQQEVISEALNAYSSGVKNVLIDAPTGFGKSIVNYFIAKEFKSAFYTTPQIVLLEQIEKDELLKDIAVVKGRENYRCNYDRRYTAANGMCIKDKNFRCYVDCDYKIARTRALNSKICAMSFAYLIYDRFVPEQYSFGSRELLIVDEADDIESWADEFGSFKFKVNNFFYSMDDVISWARSVRKKVSDTILSLSSKDVLSDAEIKEIEKLRKYYIKLTTFLSLVSKDRRNWVFECKNGYLTVKPVNVGDILNSMVWCRGKKVLASSATIISKELFCKYCGLDEDETVIIKVPAIFPKENRPVVYIPIAKMTKPERANGYTPMAEAIARIAKKHENERGLIHAHSYEIAKEIYNRLSIENRAVIFHDKENRKQAFRRFIETEGAIFISVGFARGIDLKYDLCRWQVITKIPFPDQSDIRVKELWVRRKAWNWARYQAIKSLVQSCGRIVRAEDDYGITYILDESFENLYRYKSQFPEWFLESLVMGYET